MRINFHITSLLFILVSSLAMAGDSVPELFEDHVKFSNGINLYYESHRVLFANPELARAKRLPVSISEKPIVIKEWEQVVVLKTNHYYEGGTTELILYDYSGESIFPSLEITGEVYFLRTQHRILMVEVSAHYKTDNSFILSNTGRLLAKIYHGEIFDVGISFDENVIWFYSSVVVDGSPMTKVSVFDVEGKAIKDITVKEAGLVKFEYLNKTYSLDIGPPDFPG